MCVFKSEDLLDRLTMEKGTILESYLNLTILSETKMVWAHWDLNPDLRVSLRVIAPVNHQDQMTHI
jgi:hypothetical protein